MTKLLGWGIFGAVLALGLGCGKPAEDTRPRSETTRAETKQQSELRAVGQIEVQARNLEAEIEGDLKEVKAASRLVTTERGQCFGLPREDEAICVRKIQLAAEAGEKILAALRSKVAQRVVALRSELAAVGNFPDSRDRKERLTDDLAKKKATWDSAISEIGNSLKAASP